MENINEREKASGVISLRKKLSSKIFLLSAIRLEYALKGTVPRGFRLQVFYMDQILPSP
jgi:hypothetical protein